MDAERSRAEERWWGSACLIAELRHASWARIRRAEPQGNPPQRFPGLVQIDYVVRGAADLLIGDELAEVGPGSVVVFHPGEWHGGVGSVMHPGEYFCVIVAIPERGALPGATPAETRALAQGIARLDPRVMPVSPAMDEAFRTIIAEHRQRGPFAALTARAALQRLLIDLVHRPTGMARAPTPLSAPTAAALRWIDAHLADEISIGDVARAVGSGDRGFRERFLAEIGCTPKSWLVQRRLRRAKRLLAIGRDPVLGIALATGFGSSQYFATTFKRLTGLTPLAYRQLAKRGARGEG